MTQEEKAKRYDEALERARRIYDTDRVSGIELTTCEEIFPELAKSEDEKIRKNLIKLFTSWKGKIKLDNDIPVEDVLLWLEKQAEQKSTDKVEPKFKAGDTIKLKNGDGLEWTIERIQDDGWCTIACADRDEFILLDDNWELVEQKPAWNEEDERHLNSIIKRTVAYGDSSVYGLIKDDIDWIKSLRHQNRWKPSDEQIDVLDEVIRNPYLSTAEYNGLIALKKQLKAL